MTVSGEAVRVAWYDPGHLAQLRDLHRCCFPGEGWRKEDFDKFARGRAGRANVVKVAVGEVTGTVYASLLYTTDAQSCRVRRVAVWPDHRRLGLARFAVNALCGPASLVRRRLFLARVLETNAAAQLFFSKGMRFQFDAARPRKRHPDSGLEYYEFTYAKPDVPVLGGVD